MRPLLCILVLAAVCLSAHAQFDEVIGAATSGVEGSVEELSAAPPPKSGKFSGAENLGAAIGGALAPVVTIVGLVVALVYTPLAIPLLFAVIAVEKILG